MPCGHLNAMRFAQKPLPQPAYCFLDVPAAASTLEGSSLQRVTNREHFQTCMAEMLLLGKEAVRRRKKRNAPVVDANTSGAKPLSLEYLADRLDIDDPCFGYLVRSKGNNDDNNNGMLQGFITVTTFTNWQTTFRWDSLHHEAYSFDSKEMKRQRASGERKWDSDGRLAKDLQATVRYGDVHDEGIVWPRIAEISLLGALGCGRALVKVVIEELENMKPSADRNYDYVVLQATDNSISFYESIGFVRVGGVMEDIKVKQRRQEQQLQQQSKDGETTETQQQHADQFKTPARKLTKQEAAEVSPEESEIVSSDIITYITTKRGESPLDIAKKHGVEVWDIIFLNKGMFEDPILPASKLLLGTSLRVPVPPPKKKKNKKVFRAGDRSSSRLAVMSPPKKTEDAPPEEDGADDSEDTTPEYYAAKENDTPRGIAKQFKVDCKELIQANCARLPGLVAKSRLKAGTQVKISHFHIEEEPLTAYAHWSFPDSDEYEDGEPSYLMAYRLNRKHDNKKNCKRTSEESFVQTLAVPVTDYEPTPLLWHPPSPSKSAAARRSPSPRESAQVGPLPLSSLPGAAVASDKCASTGFSPVLVAHDINGNKPIRGGVFSEGAVIKPSSAEKPPPSPATIITNETCDDKPSALPLKLLLKPKRSMGPYMIFARDQRRTNPDVAGMHIKESSKFISDLWGSTSQMVKQRYAKLAADAKKKWEQEKKAYEMQQTLLAQQPRERPPSAAEYATDNNTVTSDCRHTQELVGLEPQVASTRRRRCDEKNTLVNKVVKLMPSATKVTRTCMDHAKTDSEGNDTSKEPQYYKYWFVLTYIPDLQWCHLCPLEQAGMFGPEDKKPRLIGRPKYKLVNEELGQEVDVSSRYVVTVKSRVAKNTANADKEEWDIVDDNEDVWSSSSDEDGVKTTTAKKKKRGPRKKDPAPVRVTKKRVFEAAFGGLALLAASQPDQNQDSGSVNVEMQDGPPPPKIAKTTPAPVCRCGFGLRCPIHPPEYFGPPFPMSCPPGYALYPPPPPQAHHHYHAPHGYPYHYPPPPHDMMHFASGYPQRPPPHLQFQPHHMYYNINSGRTTPTSALAPTSDSSPDLSVGQEAAI